jgi:primosomal replication protein N
MRREEMSHLEYVNEVKVSGIVISAMEKEMTDGNVGLLIKLKNRMKTEINGEIAEREFSIQIKVSPEMYSGCFTGINQGDELMVSGYLVVDIVTLEGESTLLTT